MPTATAILPKLFENAEIQKTLREMVRPLGQLLYEHFYLYVWFICLYNVVLIFLVVAILALHLRTRKEPA